MKGTHTMADMQCDRCHARAADVRYDGRRLCADCYALHRRRRDREQEAWLAERASGAV